MEAQLLAASMKSKESFTLIREYIDLKLSTYSKQFQVLMTKIGEYYLRDESAEHVDPSLLLAQVAETIRNEKHLAMFSALMENAAVASVSDINVRATVLLAKQQEVGDKLSQALVTDAGQKNVPELMEEFQRLRSLTSLDELEAEEIKSLVIADIASLMNREMDPANVIKLYPSSLNDRLDGGAKPGHHITVFARPEMGKSAFCVNLSCGFINQGHKTVYLINEDREEDIIMRHVYNLAGMTKYDVMNDPERAEKLARDRGGSNLKVIGISPGTPSQIEEILDEEEPTTVILDQLRNVKMRADNRVNQLEAAASMARNFAKKKNLLMVSVTQAGDSADGKACLEMGDVDFSNTGIPAQADVMIGIGADATLEAEGRRMISLPKNKISGRHENFVVNIVPSLSRYSNI